MRLLQCARCFLHGQIVPVLHFSVCAQADTVCVRTFNNKAMQKSETTKSTQHSNLLKRNNKYLGRIVFEIKYLKKNNHQIVYFMYSESDAIYNM